MTAKDVKFGDSARQRMLAGVNILADAVKVATLYSLILNSIFCIRSFRIGIRVLTDIMSIVIVNLP